MPPDFLERVDENLDDVINKFIPSAQPNGGDVYRHWLCLCKWDWLVFVDGIGYAWLEGAVQVTWVPLRDEWELVGKICDYLQESAQVWWVH